MDGMHVHGADEVHQKECGQNSSDAEQSMSHGTRGIQSEHNPATEQTQSIRRIFPNEY